MAYLDVVCVFLPESQAKHEPNLFTSVGALEAVLGGPENLGTWCLCEVVAGSRLPGCSCSFGLHLLASFLLLSDACLAWGQSGLVLTALVHASGLFLCTHPSGLAFKSHASSYYLIIPTDGDNCEAEPRDHRVAQVGLCIATSTAWWLSLPCLATGLGAGAFDSLLG